MGDAKNTKSASAPYRREPSRLQRKAPASIEVVSRDVKEWNVAIPLLSPLIQSPTDDYPTSEVKSSCNKESRSEIKPAVVVLKKWQHPAAPFSYETATFRPFVCTASLDRR